jgi:hypothetical protein
MSVDMNPGEQWGKCFVEHCPLFGSLGRGSEWACYCHYRAESRDFNEITAMVWRERHIGESAVLIRMHYGTDAWAHTYRHIQKMLVAAERPDLLFNADGKDTPPISIVGREMPPVVKMWLARLELELETMANAIGHGRQPLLPNVPPTAKLIGPTHAAQFLPELGR